MDGHECAEIMFSRLERTRRLDSEFYRKKSVKMVELLKSKGAKPLTDYVQISDGNHMGISDKFTEKGIPYYRGQDIHHFFIENASPICIDEDTFRSPFMCRSHLKKNDILMSIVGTIGEIALVSTDKKATCNCKLAILRPLDEKRTAIMAVYLKTKYGFDQIDKFKRGAVQMGYLLEDVNQILIPDFSEELADMVEKAVRIVWELTEKSKEQYSMAEEYLLKEIGIETADLSASGATVKSFAESFRKTGRLDAEYYQPKYDNFEKYIEKYHGGHTTPKEEFLLIKEKCTRERSKYPYVEIGDVNIADGTAEYHMIPRQDLPANAKIMTRKGDLIISTVRPYRGAVSVLNEDDLLVSSAFTVLRKNGRYPAQTLQVLFRTALYKEWLLKFNVGTSYPVIRDADILNISIPVFDNSVHEKVKGYVKESKELLIQAQMLLEGVVQAVEMVVEAEEAAALKWLEKILSPYTKEETDEPIHIS